MIPRNFSWVVIVGFELLLAGTVFANVFADPQGVFGDDAAYRENPNWRYLELKHYQRDASQIDGLVLASSRGRSFDNDHLASRSGNQQILNFSVPYGLVTDHLPFLQYVLRDKKERGERLKSVLLLLDLDLFGKAPWTNTNIDAFLPPALSGESPVRFWWRYLTVYQYGNWRDSLRLRYRTAGRDAPSAIPAGLRADAVVEAHRSRQSWNVRRPDLTRQVLYLEQIITLCRDNGVVLTVATSPMVRTNLNGYPPGELEALMVELNRLTPIWDFGSPPWLADSPGYWVDFSHFSKAVGTMMINRMFGGDSPPDDFGRFHAKG
jgi:hypothetical protein